MTPTFPALLCLASGLALVTLCWSPRAPFASDLLMRASLSVGFGLAIFSVTFFLARVFTITNPLPLDLAVFVFLLGACLLLPARPASPFPPSPPDLTLPAWLPRALTPVFLIAFCAAFFAAVARTLAHPHGDGWDAFAIWNLRARFLFRA